MQHSDDEMREFFHMVWRALKMVTSYLERRYGFGKSRRSQ